MRAAVFFLVLSLFAGSTAHAADPAGDVFPFPVTERTLPNGLKVVVVPTDFPGLVALHINVQVGSRNELEPGKTGFAHLFEHMMFHGTKANPEAVYQAAMTAAGARQNAYTTSDYTDYFATFAKDDLDKVLSLEADRFQNLVFDEGQLKTESRAVLGEYNKNSADPWSKLDEKLRDSAFLSHPYKHTTMGFLKDIEDMPNQYAYARDFFGRWYRPERTTVIVVGDVQASTASALVEKHFGAWKQGAEVPPIAPEHGSNGPLYVHVPWESESLPWVVLAFHGPAFSATDPRHGATQLLLDLYFGETSELYKRLVTHEQKVDALAAHMPFSKDPDLVVIAARLKKPGDAIAVRDALLGTVAEARGALVPAARLQAAKSSSRYGFASELTSSASIASHLAEWMAFERRVGTVNDYFRTLASITPEQVRDAALGLFTDEQMVIATLAHGNVSPEMGRVPKLKTLETQRKERSTVDMLVRNTSLPMIDTAIVFDVGSAHDPKGKEGLASLAASMVTDAGSDDARIDEIHEKLYPMSANVGAQVDKEVTVIRASAHLDVWNAFADVAFPMLVSPGFRSQDFTRLRDAQLAALTQDLRDSNEEELGKERLQGVVYRGTAYAHPALGTVAGLKAITLDDVKAFVAKHYVRNNMTVGLAGHASDQIVERVRSELGKLPAGERTKAPKVVVPDAKGVSVDIVAKDTRATAVSMGHPIDVTRGHPDFVALYLARTWLGEHRSTMAHLFKRLREARGLNYGDYAYIEGFPGGMFRLFPTPNRPRHHQMFEVWIRPVQPKNTLFAIHAAMFELDKLVASGMTQADVDATRTYLMKNVFVMASSQDEQLGYTLDSRWFGIPEFTQYMRDGLSALTAEQVNAAIRRHIRPKDMRIVIVTKDANGLKAAIQKDGPSSITYDAPKPDELLAEDAKINARKVGASSVTVTPVNEVFAR